jgi:hypothetical protein
MVQQYVSNAYKVRGEGRPAVPRKGDVE